MNPKHRLQEELQRLYGQPAAGAAAARAAVIELARPADWSRIGAVWRAVQADLGLPAPAIAVNGRDGFQLWFALAEEALVPAATALLQALVRQHLPELQAAGRLRLWPGAEAEARPPLPPQASGPEQWSAFVAPDLAPVFQDEPWLDTEPGPDAQAEVLSRLSCLGREALQNALATLEAATADAVDLQPPPAKMPPATTLTATAAPAAPSPDSEEPRRFLLRVMNDERVDMALRIEAAKALLGTSPRP